MTNTVFGCEQFKAKWAEWRELVFQNEPARLPNSSLLEPHCIYAQIWLMMADDAAFRIARQAYFGRPKNMLFDFIERSYFRSQSLAIRRLTEKNSKDVNKIVISLTGLLDDLEQHAGCFTRANIFCAQNLAYDCQDLEARLLHEAFDYLSRVDPSNRKQSDALSIDILHDLRRELTICEPIQKAANKIVAHASNPSNRGSIAEHNKALCDILRCQRRICHVASFVSVIMLRCAQCRSFLPEPDIDDLKFFKDTGTQERWDRLAARGRLLAEDEKAFVQINGIKFGKAAMG